MSKQKIVIRIKKRPKKKKKFGFFKKLLLFLVLCIVGAGIIGYNIFKSIDDKIDSIPRAELDYDDLGISEDAKSQNNSQGIYTIAIFGIDGRPGVSGNRSDTIMILSVNTSTGDMSLTSVMRDTYVKIPDKGWRKINAAYSYGQEQLAVKTLNSNFDMSIYDYVTVSFSALENIVDALGGLELTVSEAEANEMNRLLKTDDIKAGTALFDGAKVLMYARIRYLGNSDFDRTARQRIVVKKILEKVSQVRSLKEANQIIDAVCENIQTNITTEQIYRLGYAVIKNGKLTSIERDSLTSDDYLKAVKISGEECLTPYPLYKLANKLHSIVYPLQSYSPTNEIKKLSNELSDKIYGLPVRTIYTGSTIKDN